MYCLASCVSASAYGVNASAPSSALKLQVQDLLLPQDFWLPWLWLLDWLCNFGAHAARQHAMAKAAARVYAYILRWWKYFLPAGATTCLSCAC